MYSFLRKFLTWREQEDFWRRFHGITAIFETRNPAATRYLAGRWAAKEATIKASSAWRTLSFHHIQILNREDGQVYALVLERPASGLSPERFTDAGAVHAEPSEPAGETSLTEGRDGLVRRLPTPPTRPPDGTTIWIAPEEQNDDLPGQIAKISISHDGEYATAVCLAAEEPRDGDVGGEAAAREPL